MATGELTYCLEGSRTLAHYVKAAREGDARIQAWTQLEALPATGPGPLDGVPFGVKDIFETIGLRTEFGSPIFAGRVSAVDAGLVSMLRARGAIVMGKTHTTAFAYFDAAPTRNPRHPEHTPGGSSSGSAAAVAAGMVPFALGSQTQGSVLRPASFCGIVGLKPTHGFLPMDGVLPFAPSLDTGGLFTQTAEDMRCLWERMGFAAHSDAGIRFAAFPAPAEVEPPMQAAFSAAVSRLGASIVEPPPAFARMHLSVKLMQDYEGARTHQETYRRHGVAVGAKLAGMIERGLAIPEEEYLAARHNVDEARREMKALFASHPVILSPAALGPAPRDLTYTGDPRMNSPWTGLGVPAISVPLPVAQGELPLGLQMAAARGQEALLLRAACIVEG